MEESYLLVCQKQNKKGDDTTEFKECDGKLIIKQFKGLNTDNFIIKKSNEKKIQFSFFKINSIYYVNINNIHIIDYKRFISIQSMSNIDNSVKIKNTYIGDFSIEDCDVEILTKALSVMNNFMKNKKNTYKDFLDMILSN